MSDRQDDSNPKKAQSLSETDIVSDRSIDRWSALRAVATVVTGAVVAAVATVPGEAEAQCTDSDGGRWADRPGRGRRCRRVVYRRPTGFTDRDPSDGAGYGVCPLRGFTDSDAGGASDPGGRGRGPCH